MNPRTAFEHIYPDVPPKAEKPRTIGVIGAGPAGVITAVTAACPQADLTVQRELLEKVSLRLTAATKALNSLTELVEQVDAMEDVKEMALAYHDQIVPAMAALRKPVDEMELLVDKSIWPVPTYGDLMFEV